jgi:malonate transporter and related proteins
MWTILAVTIPFFALVLCGYLAARSKLLPESAIPGLNSFVLFFALPCLLYRFGAQLPVRHLLDPVVIVVYIVCMLVMVFGTIAVTRSERIGIKDAAFGALTTAFPNTGFMGVPLIAVLLGPQAAGPVLSTLLVDMLITNSLCISVAHAKERAGSGFAADILRALRGAIVNPLPWAIALGMAASVTEFRLPGPLDSVVRMLADAATPVALFTIGTVLWRAGAHVHARTPPRLFVPLALIKLLVHPLLVLGIGGAAMFLGAPLSSFTLSVLVLAAALPSASSVSLLAERYGADNGRIARAIVTSTVLAFVTFTLAAWVAQLVLR